MRLKMTDLQRFAKKTIEEERVRRRPLTEAGLAKPEKGVEHRMYHDKRLGDAVKQHAGPELSDVWYETAARRFLQDYGRDLEQNWEEAVVHRFCSSTKATSGVEIDEERLLDAIREMLEEREDEVIETSSLKETVQRLRAEAEREERILVSRRAPMVETPMRHLHRTRTLTEMVEAPESDLRSFISAMQPDDLADDDYVDIDSGEVHLAKGKKASTSKLHPAFSPRKAPAYVEEDPWDEYQTALEEFASGWEGLGHDPSEAADAAESFFANYTDWKFWATELGLSREEMKSEVIDAIVEAMGR